MRNLWVRIFSCSNLSAGENVLLHLKQSLIIFFLELSIYFQPREPKKIFYIIRKGWSLAALSKFTKNQISQIRTIIFEKKYLLLILCPKHENLVLFQLAFFRKVWKIQWKTLQWWYYRPWRIFDMNAFVCVLWWTF